MYKLYGMFSSIYLNNHWKVDDVVLLLKPQMPKNISIHFYFYRLCELATNKIQVKKK